MFVLIHQWMVSAGTSVNCPADELSWDGKRETPLLIPCIQNHDESKHEP